ncbi:MAG: FAD-dependent oxidoreductase [Pseudonocardiaceae bacterium]
MTEPLDVIIVGGGIAGLCLAQGLRQAGVSVAVYERDRSPTDRLDGYRIHINSTTAVAPPVICSSVRTALAQRCAGSSSRTPSGCRPRPSVPHCGSR